MREKLSEEKDGEAEGGRCWHGREDGGNAIEVGVEEREKEMWTENRKKMKEGERTREVRKRI